MGGMLGERPTLKQFLDPSMKGKKKKLDLMFGGPKATPIVGRAIDPSTGNASLAMANQVGANTIIGEKLGG